MDFFCAEAMLAVEVDGASHQDPERAELDRRRSAWLATRNIRVVRIAARDVRDELPHVLDFIGRTALERLPPGSPPPLRRPEGRRATSPRCGEEK
ncbi:endonuclease domain-containing protein [Brevundimonas sp.]|uniref:endonuclease domain-containing protein n=1 Tax=Brevundimonas sp. TaxID=1871086 RepID=UPI002ABA2717|nr:DUF559 domain-containing protein [Brevundimonas sp.]MDZ4363443.1 DUF559 domain-containing protein [Brevundimonas sp.]